MIYAKIIKTEAGCIWLLSAEENKIYADDFKNKIEYQRAVIDLMVQDVIGDYEVIRLDNGAPKLDSLSDSHISISHSHGWFALYFSSVEPVGVDVEFMKRDLQPRKDYFLNENELTQNWTNTELYVIWCAKEAVFKLKDGNIEKLMEDVTIHKITQDKIQTSLHKQQLLLDYFLFNDGMIAYT